MAQLITTEMRKLKALIFQDDVDAVLRFLGEAGIVELIDVHEKIEAWGGTLKPFEVPAEMSQRYSSILSRIERLIKELELKPEELPSVERVPILKKRSEDILTDIENKLSEIEKRYSEISVSLKERKILTERLKGLAETSEKVALKEAISELTKKLTEARMELGKEIMLVKALTQMEEQVANAKSTVGAIREDLLTIQRTVEMEKGVTEAKALLAATATTAYLEAWVPTAHVEEATNLIKKATNGNCLVADEPPRPGEKVPTLVVTPTAITAPAPTPSLKAPLGHRPAFGAYARIVTAFGWPSPKEIDPTLFMAVTFPIIFGIMFADVGQGAVMAAFGLFLAFYRSRLEKQIERGRAKPPGDITRYFLICGELFISCGIAAILFGFLFGEFFGPSEVIHPITLVKFGPVQIGGFDPLGNPKQFMIFAVIVGVAHIASSIVLRLLTEIKRHHYKLIPMPMAWIWLLFGGTYMWLSFGGISNLDKWFTSPASLITFIISPLAIIILSTAIAESMMEGLAFGLEVFAETLGHTMSYLRLMALGLTHSVMNYLFLIMAGVEHGLIPLTGIPIIAAGTFLVMIFEGLAVFIHTLRLHWVEWFSAFFRGEGLPPTAAIPAPIVRGAPFKAFKFERS